MEILRTKKYDLYYGKYIKTIANKTDDPIYFKAGIEKSHIDWEHCNNPHRDSGIDTIVYKEVSEKEFSEMNLDEFLLSFFVKPHDTYFVDSAARIE